MGTELNDIPSDNGANGDNQALKPAQQDAKGRFLPGNKLSKGNPLVVRIAAYRQAFQRAVTDDDMQAIAAKACELAKAGDVGCMRFVADYTLGKPVPVIEADDGSGTMIPGALVINLVAPRA